MNLTPVPTSVTVLPATDTISIVKGSADATKKARFEVDGITTATTRVLTIPDANITLADANRTVSAGGLITGGGALTANITLTLAGTTIFTDLLTRDGTGSGLDADMVDGSHAAAFATDAELSAVNDTAQEAHELIVLIQDDFDAHAALTAAHGATGAVVGTSDSQTLTNKSIALATNTLTGTKAQFDITCTDDNFAFLGQAQTFVGNQVITGTLAVSGALTAASIDSTGIVKAINGTAAAPSFCFQSSSGHGMWRGGTTSLGFATSGVQRMLLNGDIATFSGAIIAASLNLGGATVTDILTATATLDFGSTAAQASADLTITVTGAAVGDTVIIVPPAAPAANTSFSGHVSAADTVTVRHNNYSSGSVDPASGTYRATVIKI